MCNGIGVLVVDDEEMILRVAQKILAHAGYRVFPAASGREALELFSSEPGRIHLLLTDLVMPGMRGDELAETIRRQLPSLPLVVMSGNLEGSVKPKLALRPGENFLQKPFGASELIAVIGAQLQPWSLSGARGALLPHREQQPSIAAPPVTA
jgi:CheY-like chemotaxis protein